MCLPMKAYENLAEQRVGLENYFYNLKIAGKVLIYVFVVVVVVSFKHFQCAHELTHRMCELISPSTMWIPEITVGLSSLATSTSPPRGSMSS